MLKQEVKQCKEEWDAVMDKLSRSANIIIGVGKLCQTHGLAEDDLPDGLRTILKSLYRYVWPISSTFRCLSK